MMTEGMINIGDWIKQWAMIKPNKIAIISDDIPYTYRELNRRINRLSHLFLELGVKKGTGSPSSSITANSSSKFSSPYRSSAESSFPSTGDWPFRNWNSLSKTVVQTH